MSAGLDTGASITSTENLFATDWADGRPILEPGLAGLYMNATRLTCGAICLSRSIHFAPTVGSRFDNPVMLPPGRDNAITNPCATGSLTPMKTIGVAAAIV